MSLAPLRVPRPTERIGDAERDAACDALAAHFALGRLTQDEMHQRSAATLTARTRSDLYDVLADLPLLTDHPSMQHPAPTPAPTSQFADGVIGFFAISAVICFVLTLLVSLTFPPAAIMLMLGGLAGSVAMYGLWHFRTRRAGRCTCPHRP